MSEHDVQLFLDTETSGLPDNRESYQHVSQPWVVQLAAVLSDESRIYQQINLVIRADGRAIDPEAMATHGFTTEICDHVGIKEQYAAALLLNMAQFATTIVCHNVNFDRLVSMVMLHRNYGEKHADWFGAKPFYCTMREGAEAAGILENRLAILFPTFPGQTFIARLKEAKCRWDAKNRYWHGLDTPELHALASELHASTYEFTEYKWPSLQELHCALFGANFEDAHDALADVLACRKCYYELQSRLRRRAEGPAAA